MNYLSSMVKRRHCIRRNLSSKAEIALKEEDYGVVVVVVVIFHVLNIVAPRSQFLEQQFSREEMNTLMMVFLCVMCI